VGSSATIAGSTTIARESPPAVVHHQGLIGGVILAVNQTNNTKAVSTCLRRSALKGGEQQRNFDVFRGAQHGNEIKVEDKPNVKSHTKPTDSLMPLKA
jgi:hypothetical protein